MALLETLGIILTSETAGSVAKFLYEKVEKYIREKFGNNPPDEVEDLKNQVEELKNKLETKEKEDVTNSEVEEVKKTVRKIEQTETQVPAEIISPEVFRKWSESDELDIEDQGIIARRQIQILIEKSNELNIKASKQFEIQDVAANIDRMLKNFKKARLDARLSGLRDDEEKEGKLEMQLRRNIFHANNLLKGY